MEPLTLGVIGSSRKENERRAPIHPAHVAQLAPEVRERVVFERGYGLPFGVPDEDLARRCKGLASREELLAEAGVVLLPKPLEADLAELREGGILWGWPHCVQQEGITQLAIDRRLTLIAWEAMFLWRNGVRDMHLFQRNNEMAGYCGVLHAMSLAGLDGHYGAPLSAVVVSLGSVSRGAIRALRGLGVDRITVYTQRPPWAVRDMVMGCRYGRMLREGDELLAVGEDGGRRPFADALVEADVVVNGILQDTERPLMFLSSDDVERLRPASLIVDVSCDLGMGFPFARPTSFVEPTFPVGAATYYAVDHTPTLLWSSATWELSRAVLPYVPTVLGGPPAWERDETIARAIEVRDGVVGNPRILSFQDRAEEYPHRKRG